MIIKDMPEFSTKKEEINWIISNKERIVKIAKEQIKHADCISCVAFPNYGNVSKATNIENKNTLDVSVIINTTNLLDSHQDVHLPGIWDKSLNENKYIMHLQEHSLRFSKIIADQDELDAKAVTYAWKELGVDYEGSTQALQFNSTLKVERNPFMFEQYRKGYVKQHSVGMRYVRLIFAANDESYGAEFDAWNKYYPEIANKEKADDYGYFWAVPEAKIIEGSAVPLGSNWVTPTMSTKGVPTRATRLINNPQPSLDTEAARKIISKQFKQLLK